MTMTRREAQARIEIDRQLMAARRPVQSQDALNLATGPRVAVREFTLEPSQGRVDYLLVVNEHAVAVMEALATPT